MKMKKVAITALCAGLLCSSVAGITASANAEAVDFAKDASKWESLSSASVDGEKGLYATAQTFTAVSTTVGGNSSAEITADFSKVGGSWGVFIVYFKWNSKIDSASWSFGVDYDYAITASEGIKSTGATGDWLGLVMSYGAAPFVLECTDGTISNVGAIPGINGYDFWYTFNQKNVISLSTTDGESGVSYSVAFEAPEAANNNGKKTYELASVNTDLRGDGGYVISRVCGDGTFSSATGLINAMVTDVASEYEAPAAPDDAWANFACDDANVRAGKNLENFTFDSNGMDFTGATEGGVVFNQKIADKKTVLLEFDGSLTSAEYGNVYVVFKNKTAKPVYTSITPASSGNYLALQIGGDGTKIIECINGVVTTTNFISNDWTDFYYVYKQKTTVQIYTEDTAAGVDVNITLKGASGVQRTGTYTSTNTALHGEARVGVEYFLGAEGSGIESLKLKSLKISDVETITLPDIDAAALNQQLINADGVAITALNVDEYTQLLATAKAQYDEMNHTQIASFEAYRINKLELALNNYDAVKDDVAAVVSQIEALTTEITKENYEAEKAATTAARTAYNALTSTGKSAVYNVDALDDAEAAIAAYELAESQKGCGSSGISLAMGAIALLGVAVLKKRKED